MENKRKKKMALAMCEACSILCSQFLPCSTFPVIKESQITKLPVLGDWACE